MNDTDPTYQMVEVTVDKLVARYSMLAKDDPNPFVSIAIAEAKLLLQAVIPEEDLFDELEILVQGMGAGIACYWLAKHTCDDAKEEIFIKGFQGMAALRMRQLLTDCTNMNTVWKEQEEARAAKAKAKTKVHAKKKKR